MRAIRLGKALEERRPVVSDERPGRAFVHGTGLAQRMERAVDLALEAAAARGINAALEIEELAQPFGFEVTA